jgi:hypothetical protein
MLRANIKPEYYRNEIKNVTIINIQIIPQMTLSKFDSDYELYQENQIHVIFINDAGKIEDEIVKNYDDIEILNEIN